MREFSIPLLAGVGAALVWANLDQVGYDFFVKKPLVGGVSFHFLSNEIFMVLFFGIAAVEITRSVFPGGDLNPLKKAINPLFATAGGVLGPVAAYFLFNAFFGSDQLTRGWGIPTATDIAIAWLAARLAFGEGHPAIMYLLLLAVGDDAIGLAIIAIFYPNPELPVNPAWLLLTVLGMLTAWGLRRRKVNSYWPYLLTGGVLSWSGLHEAHLHPALALVFIVPFMPHNEQGHSHLFELEERGASTLIRFEHDWKVIVDFGLFLFGLANAGVAFSQFGPATWIVLAALSVGKCAGIFVFGWLAGRLGFQLPEGMGLRHLFVVGILAGTGFTVALFVAGEAFVDPLVCDAAKMGAMLSIVASILGIMLGLTPWFRQKGRCSRE